MEREEKKRKGKKQEEYMGIKLKHCVFVGEKRENSTPTTTWKVGLAQSDGSLLHVQNSNFPIINTLSARKLGANIKKTQTCLKAVNMKKGGFGVSHYSSEKDKIVELQTQMAEPPDEQPASASSLRRHIAAALSQHHQFVGINGHALQPVSLASPDSSLEVAPYYSALTPASPLDFTDQGEVSYNVKTSAELLKILNHIWSLEDQHASNLSSMKTLKKELEHSRAQIKKLLQEKKRDRRDINELMEQNASDIAVRRKEEQDRTRNAILTVRDELESERKLRKHSESLHRKLARELLEVKSSFSNSLKELEREKKARILLENLCDEFAKEITDYEQKVRSLMHKPDKDLISRESPDRLILHISESWLDERMQMKLAEASADKSTIVDKLSFEIESFLQAKKPIHSGLSSKKPQEKRLRRYSLESFHLNDVASAPRNGDYEEDSIGSGLNSLESNTHSSGRNKFQSGDVFKNSDQSSLQNQFQEHSATTVTCDGKLVNYQKSETTQEGKQKRAVSHDFYSITRNYSLSRNDGKLQNEKHCTEDSLDLCAFLSHPTIKQETISRITTLEPEVSESSRKGLQGIKEHSLKARLLQAKLESQHLRMKNSTSFFF